MTRQEYTISHTGSVLEDAGDDAVWRHQNQVDPQRETEILTFECPDNFDSISWTGRRDPVRFKPRTAEVQTEAGTTYTLDSNIGPVAGNEDLDDQPYPAVEAAVDGEYVEIETVDYADNSVTLEEAPADGADVAFFPIITEGTIKMRAMNSLGQNEGPLFPWGFPIYRWHDMKQDKRGTEVNLSGSIRWDRNEQLQIMMDSTEQIVWEHEEYPGSYVSTLEMDVQIAF